MGDLELQNSRLRASVAAMRSEMEGLHALLAESAGSAELPGTSRSPAAGPGGAQDGARGAAAAAATGGFATPRDAIALDGSSPLPSPPSWCGSLGRRRCLPPLALLR